MNGISFESALNETVIKVELNSDFTPGCKETLYEMLKSANNTEQYKEAHRLVCADFKRESAEVYAIVTECISLLSRDGINGKAQARAKLMKVLDILEVEE